MPGLYIATDQDQDYDPAYDPTTATGEEGEEQEEDYYEEYYEEEEEEEEPAPLKLVSDVSDEAYWDDTALTNCWLAAVSDFKYSHPSNFAPIQQAPRTTEQKHSLAPLWYGPRAPPPTSPSSLSISTTNTTTNLNQPTKKRKKGSKAARRAAAKRQKLLNQDDNDHSDDATDPYAFIPASPTALTPSSSTRDLPPHIPPSTATTTTTTTFAGPSLPTPSEFIPPQLPPSLTTSSRPSFPTSYPSPPPIVDVPEGGAEDEEEASTPEQLLQGALWAWYTAGYNTALYHAAMGVAGKIKVEEGETEAEEQKVDDEGGEQAMALESD